IIEISSDSSEDRKGATKATAPIFYGPSTQGLIDAYGYNTIEEYQSWNYFPSIDNESIDMETIDKRNTDKDCIVDSNSAMSKACTLHLQLTYAHCIYTLHLQLAFASKHLHIAFANCICTLHLQIAYAHCICTLHMHIAFVHCICILHLQASICTLHLQAKVLIKTILKVKQVENKQREKKPQFNKKHSLSY
ncbi:hypothetical protein Tco_1152298, partial [Tanacetum coccineum]